MPSGTDTNRKDARRPVSAGDLFESKKSFSVVLDGIRSEIETRDSFAIKFSLLAKAPLSKVKHLMSSMPATIWSGSGRSRAESVLKLIEEAGGNGSIVEMGGAVPANPAKAPEKASKTEATCAWCGFPMKEGESVCGFCMTSAKDGAPKVEPRTPSRKRHKAVEPKRLLIYGAVLAAGIIVITLLIR